MCLKTAIDFVDHWQTLVAGILAVGAAAITINQTGTAERRRLRRQMYAARVTLPLVLSGVSSWAEEVAHLLQVELGKATWAGDGIPLGKGFALPSPPTAHVAELKQMVEATDDVLVIDRIAKLVQNIQILTSRLEGMSDPILIATKSNIESYLIKSGVIHAQASSIFDFARLRTESVPKKIYWDDVRKSLTICDCHGPSFLATFETIASYEKDGLRPESERL